MQSVKSSLKLWLSMQCQMLGNVSVAMLAQTSESPLAILAKWPQSSEIDASMQDALMQSVHKERLHIAPIGEQLIVSQPLVFDEKVWGVLVLRLNSADKKSLPAVLKNLKLGQYWLQFLLHQHNDRNSLAVAPVFEKGIADAALLQINASLLKENSLQEMAISLVNLLAGFLQATRVSLGLFERKHLNLEAISFSANFDQRTQAMQLLNEVMAEAIEQGSAIDCTKIDVPADITGTEIPAPLMIKHAHEQLLHQQHLQAVHTFLLRKSNVVIGSLTIELDKYDSLSDDQRMFVQQLLHFASGILSLQKQASSGLWRAVQWRMERRMKHWFGEESLGAKLIAVVALIFVVALFIPVNYRLSADAGLRTTEKYLVVSPQDGYLGKVQVRPGVAVKKGDILAKLNDDDLRLERRKLSSQVLQYRQAYDSALAGSLRVEAAIASAQMDQASIQLRLIDQQLERTQLIAPIDGIIVSDDISQSQGAPVKQGELLFEVAAVSGFLVQLFVDERDIAAVQTGQSGDVKFTSLPNEIFELRVKSITPISEVKAGRNYFRVEAELVNELPSLRPGMTGSGKLIMGKRALGWVLFHDVWHWLWLKLW
jgi:hypothetical protein